jgi:hypothetical protein
LLSARVAPCLPPWPQRPHAEGGRESGTETEEEGKRREHQATQRGDETRMRETVFHFSFLSLLSFHFLLPPLFVCSCVLPRCCLCLIPVSPEPLTRPGAVSGAWGSREGPPPALLRLGLGRGSRVNSPVRVI